MTSAFPSAGSAAVHLPIGKCAARYGMEKRGDVTPSGNASC